MSMPAENPHQGQPIIEAGTALHEANVGVILVPGRGATGQSMLRFAEALNQPKAAFRALQASGYSWYPNSFLAPIKLNQPGIRSGIQAISDTFGEIEGSGMPASQIVILGFSQGACLSLEYAARTPRRLGGVVAWSGGLIGTDQIENTPPPLDKLFNYPGNLEGTPVFLGCSDIDAHVPIERVQQTASVMENLDATVECRIYPGMGHTVNLDEIRYARTLLERLANER